MCHLSLLILFTQKHVSMGHLLTFHFIDRIKSTTILLNFFQVYDYQGERFADFS